MLIVDPGSLTFVVVGLLTLVILVLTVALCLCKQRLGKSGSCPIDNHLQVNRELPAVKPQLPEGQQNGDVRPASPSDKGAAHTRAVTERALPTPPGRPQSLPASLVIANNNGSTPLATTTPDSRSSTLVRPHRRNKAPAPPPPAQVTTPSASTAEDAQERGDTRSESSESDPLYSVATARQLCAADDPAPPVPEKRFETSSEPCTSDGAFRPLSAINNGEASSAASMLPAIAPAPEVPFAAATLTEPLASAASTNGTSDLSYTVISVREPLAKVREETMRQRRVQNSATQEAFYTEVPEEEQMYAEIESGHNSAGSSVTYARIEPRGPDQPPAPPTVESLKSVAQAHSRQASTSSFTGGTSPDGEANALYTTVDKSSKQRQTIHVSEGLSAEGVPLNDLYAKVHKTRTTRNQEDAHKSKPTATTDEASLSHRPRSLPVGVDAALPHDGRALLPAHDVVPLVEPLPPPPVEYADPAYERVYHQDSSDTDPCYERVSGGRTDISDSDYERVGNSEAGYETIRRDASVMYDEPDYEKIRKSNDASCSADAKEGAYMTVSDREVDYAVEHGYERIKGTKDASYDETSDPGYERIKRRDDQNYDEVSDPGYEKIRKIEDDVFLHADSDPGYERIKESNLHKRVGSGERHRARTRKQGEASSSTKATKQNGGSSDETYECLPGSKVKPRELGYRLMKDAPSSGDSQSVSWKGDSSSSLDKADAIEDSSSEEPGYDRVKLSRDDAVPPEAPPRGRLSLRTKGWPSSDSNLTNVCQEQASQCNLSASASAVVHDPASAAQDGAVARMYDSSGVALYEVVPEVKVQVEDSPVVWTRNSSHRASDHREYIF
ncbi:uncharacterized protein LOC135400734 isoform X2 [Ornithodoros turicata]|uniref:uncharacterized protein LOC135400734 isoform X2 n=1 Tax=Ornithodoros turicata TaxID=34597 RepID=UPI0031393396